jgi:hypothetical protein
MAILKWLYSFLMGRICLSLAVSSDNPGHLTWAHTSTTMLYLDRRKIIRRRFFYWVAVIDFNCYTDNITGPITENHLRMSQYGRPRSQKGL